MFLSRQSALKKTGAACTVHDDDYSKLSYYLHCATKSVGVDILPDDLIEYQSARMLSQEKKDMILKIAYEIITPDAVVDKVFHRDPGGLCEDCNNEFYELSQVDTILGVSD